MVGSDDIPVIVDRKDIIPGMLSTWMDRWVRWTPGNVGRFALETRTEGWATTDCDGGLEKCTSLDAAIWHG
jgi:hypothetical protein